MPERLRESTYGCHDTPEQNTNRDQSHAIIGVGESGDGNTQHHVKDRKGKAMQQAKLEIGNIQRFAYGINEQSKNGAIEK